MAEFFAQLMHYEAGPTWRTVALCVLLSFVLCQLLATVYVWTYHGLSYSQTFASAQVMGGMVATILLLAIGNNVARGLGLLGTLALIRFRSTLKDPRDMVYVFASLSVGIAVGVQSFSVAIVGTIAFCLLALHLRFTSFGSRRQFDGLLRFQAPAKPELDGGIKKILLGHCSRFVLINLREVAQGTKLEHAYQIRLRDEAFADSLVMALRSVGDLNGVSLMMQDESLEV